MKSKIRLNSEAKKPSELKSRFKGHWGIEEFKIPEIWRKYKGRGIKVAILDTGVDVQHKDLLIKPNNYWDAVADEQNTPQLDEKCNILNRNLTFKDLYHGTFVTGIIGARNENGMQGIAPEAELLVCRVISSDGFVDVDNLIQGMRWARIKGANIINLSVETDSCCVKKRNTRVCLEQQINSCLKEGITVVCQAGNNADDFRDTILYPAAYQGSIAVGSIVKGGQIAQGSRGNLLDFLAPGHDVNSTAPCNTYVNDKGASFAAAFVSGLVALLMEACGNKGEDFTIPFNIKKLLINSADDVNERGIDRLSGYGVINPIELFKNYL